MRVWKMAPLRLTVIAVLMLTTTALILPSYSSNAQEQAGDLQPERTVAAPFGDSMLASINATGEFLVAPVPTLRPFSHLVLRYEAQVPAGAALRLFVRVSADGAAWTDWSAVASSDDMRRPEDSPNVVWSDIIDAGALMRFWQARVVMAPAADGSFPTIGAIEAHTVDALTGPVAPPAADFIKPQGIGLAKPPVVSRTAWGSPDGQGSRASPAYYPVNHIIVHHTADGNTLAPGQPNWAARVRAIWAYHAITRGWGDIGYNYLIDPNGVIYEGRAGGDDAVGFHDTANYGSMGVALIGTFSGAAPSPAAQEALVRLIAWKAAQKDIDPLGRSYYYGCSRSSRCLPFNPGAIVPNIAGHRQVTPGHTTCPGDATMAILPDLRNRVLALLRESGGTSDNGDLVIDERESSFSRSVANWYSAACGAGDHAFYTFATNNPAESSNRGVWRPNLPHRGAYRVLAHIPRNCGLGPLTKNARYVVHSAAGSVVVPVSQESVEGWVDLGVYTFEAGNGGAVELNDLTGEALAARRVILFDAVKWVPENPQASAQIVAVRFERTTIAAGELLRVDVTVRNTGSTIITGQDPRVDLTAGGGMNDPANAYVYEQHECFAGSPTSAFPAFPKEAGRIRITLGMPGWGALYGSGCTAPTSDYPWRWGLNSELAPGQEQTIVGYVRFHTPGTYTLRAGLIHEYVRYLAQDVGTTTITVTDERIPPDAATFDEWLRPTARVYRLGPAPDSLLARAGDAQAIPLGAEVGSFAWQGELIDWGNSGPLGLTDHFAVVQTRTFYAPVSGEYTFRTISDDGSWLLVNGRIVVANGGLHDRSEATGTIYLDAGLHALSAIFFELRGTAAAGYDVRLPGSSVFQPAPDGLSGSLRFGGTFAEPTTLALAADDRGGSGVAAIRWRLNESLWQTTAGRIVRLDLPGNGTYRVRYQAVDAMGNEGPVRELTARVDTNLTVHRIALPMMVR
ncbi:MAG: N-acetylmuramoyl-L-alanine amidase [Roseiflexus sp.]|nr:N-acetylmuramoyl-L-alanine amidase [Roseiflexus sp.]MCS7290959.1 N-acetylmuramoyl-L-alanine amidase [Roseiflexus sp.]MDW8233872.1 N-acetylmuramoyl-L-alanine amidase [Roseiflexaceae bacterium]